MAAVAVAAPATAAPAADPIVPGDQYVSLGSSFAAGLGLDPAGEGPVFCTRSSQNYAHLVADELDLATLTDASCSGATTSNVVANRANGALPQFGYLPPQVAAITPDTDLVTITIGGNDVNYISDINKNSCAIDPVTGQDPVFGPFTPFVCAGPVDPSKVTRQAFTGLTNELIALVDEIRAAAPGARIVFVDYLTVLPQNGQPCAATPTLTREEIRYSLEVARQLQLATKHAAQQSGAELVELSKASRGHDVCSADPWVDGYVAGSAYHPNAAGMQAAAELLIDQLG